LAGAKLLLAFVPFANALLITLNIVGACRADGGDVAISRDRRCSKKKKKKKQTKKIERKKRKKKNEEAVTGQLRKMCCATSSALLVARGIFNRGRCAK
jgi:hypothetical protein